MDIQEVRGSRGWWGHPLPYSFYRLISKRFSDTALFLAAAISGTISPFYGFSIFYIPFGKIDRHRCKEESKISKVADFESNFLNCLTKTNTAPQSREILQTFVAPTPTIRSFRAFAKVYLGLLQLCSTVKLAKLTNFKTVILAVTVDIPQLVPIKTLKLWKVLFGKLRGTVG